MKKYLLLSLLIHLGCFGFFNFFKQSQALDGFVPGRSAVEIFLSKTQVKAFADKGNKENFTNGSNYQKAGIETLRTLVKHNEPPRYPLLALKNNWSGAVILRFFINNSGKLDEVLVVSSSGYPLLDKAALSAAVNWQFFNGPQNVQIDYPVKFIIKES